MGALATTGAASANPGVVSRFTRRPYFSVTGALYSQRTPALMVSVDAARKSSLAYRS